MRPAASTAEISECDHVAGSGDQQDALATAVLVLDLLERVQVENRVLHGHREHVGDLEGQRLAQLGDRHPRKVELADDDLLVGHADDDLLGAELHPRPKLADGCRNGFAVDDFAVAHGARREGYLPEPLQRRLILGPGDLSRANARRADVEADGSASRHSSPFLREMLGPILAVTRMFGRSEQRLEGRMVEFASISRRNRWRGNRPPEWESGPDDVQVRVRDAAADEAPR